MSEQIQVPIEGDRAHQREVAGRTMVAPMRYLVAERGEAGG